MAGFLVNVYPGWMVMLSRGNKYIIVILVSLFFSCIRKETEKHDSASISKTLIGLKAYNTIYYQIIDSMNHFAANKLRSYEAEYTYSYKIDSLICFNKDTNRFITCRHLYVNIPGATADDLQFILGEKINNHWYIFKSASIAIPRSMIKSHPQNIPLSYSQLHQIALKEVYGGYLKPNGEINEDWFTSHFEGPGWGDFENQESSLKFLNTTEKFTDRRKFFEAIHLQSVKNNWASRDTTQPIIQLHSNL